MRLLLSVPPNGSVREKNALSGRFLEQDAHKTCRNATALVIAMGNDHDRTCDSNQYYMQIHHDHG